jgi:hypothetical protein
MLLISFHKTVANFYVCDANVNLSTDKFAPVATRDGAARRPGVPAVRGGLSFTRDSSSPACVQQARDLRLDLLDVPR